MVREAVTGAIELRYRGRLIRWTEIPAPPPRPTPARIAAPPRTVPASAPRRPSADHPWSRGYAERQQRAVELGRACPGALTLGTKTEQGKGTFLFR